MITQMDRLFCWWKKCSAEPVFTMYTWHCLMVDLTCDIQEEHSLGLGFGVRGHDCVVGHMCSFDSMQCQQFPVSSAGKHSFGVLRITGFQKQRYSIHKPADWCDRGIGIRSQIQTQSLSWSSAKSRGRVFKSRNDRKKVKTVYCVIS